MLSGLPGGSTRLVVRERYTYLCWWVALMAESTEVISIMMTQRMPRGIRDRTERASLARAR